MTLIMRLRRTLLPFVLVITLALASGCGDEQPEDEDSGIPNPASEYCEEQGGTLDIRTADDGSQTGYCIFDDGSECDEWAYYRSECEPGS